MASLGIIRAALLLKRGNITQTAIYLDIPPERLRAKVKSTPFLQDTIAEVKGQFVDKARDVVEHLLEAKDGATARWVLEKYDGAGDGRLADDQLEKIVTTFAAVAGGVEGLHRLRAAIAPSEPKK